MGVVKHVMMACHSWPGSHPHAPLQAGSVNTLWDVPRGRHNFTWATCRACIAGSHSSYVHEHCPGPLSERQIPPLDSLDPVPAPAHLCPPHTSALGIMRRPCTQPSHLLTAHAQAPCMNSTGAGIMSTPWVSPPGQAELLLRQDDQVLIRVKQAYPGVACPKPPAWKQHPFRNQMLHGFGKDSSSQECKQQWLDYTSLTTWSRFWVRS
jgi:hypothetical protein